MSATAAELPRATVNAKLVSLIAAAAISFGVFLSGFVLREPAPYELYMAGLIAVWALFDLRISHRVLPLLVFLTLFCIGGMMSLTQMADLRDTPLYVAVSLFLAFTAVFVAAAIEMRPALLRPMFLAWVAAAVLTAILGILGYFSAFPGAEMFTRYGRASGVFEDPNVFGPFLVLPGIFLLHRLMTGSLARAPLYALPLIVIAAGIFLSFSRGAWGLVAAAALLLISALFLQSSSGVFRLRIAVMSLAACVLLAVVVAIALQIPAVSELFSLRAQLVQDYDSSRLGRFSRYAPGFLMAMENPLGIGPLTFGRIFGEDTHNIWLKALLDYGWLGFAAYLTLIVWTLAAGFRILFRNRPWQPYLLCAYVVLSGHVALGTIIDTDHWRHFYILLGMVWGGIALESRQQRRARSGAISIDPPGHMPLDSSRFGA